MKILTLLHEFLGDNNVHGVGVVAYSLAQELKPDHEVVIIDRDYSNSYGYKRNDYKGIRRYTILTPQHGFHIMREHEYFHNETLDILAEILEIERYFNVAHIHHLHRWPKETIPFLKKRNLPVVLSLHDYTYICPTTNYWNRYLKKTCSADIEKNCAVCLKDLGSYRFGKEGSLTWYRDNILEPRGEYSEMIMKSDAVIYPSESFWNRYKEEGIAHPFAVKIPHFLNIPQPSQHVRHEFVFGFIGNIGFGKGVETLLGAFSKIENKNIRLHIYGSVHDQKIHQQVLATDSRIEYKGSYKLDKLPVILSSLDVIVSPSIFPESFNLCAYSAAALGKFFIVSEESYHEEFMEQNKNCATFRTGNSDHLREKMIGAIKSYVRSVPKTRQQSFASAYLDVYQRLLNRERLTTKASLFIYANKAEDLCLENYSFEEIFVCFDPEELDAKTVSSLLSGRWKTSHSAVPVSSRVDIIAFLKLAKFDSIIAFNSADLSALCKEFRSRFQPLKKMYCEMTSDGSFSDKETENPRGILIAKT